MTNRFHVVEMLSKGEKENKMFSFRVSQLPFSLTSTAVVPHKSASCKYTIFKKRFMLWEAIVY